MTTKSVELARLRSQIELARDRMQTYEAGFLPGDLGPPRKDDTLEKLVAIENALIANYERAIAIWEGF
jgi:hypothetical protein